MVITRSILARVYGVTPHALVRWESVADCSNVEELHRAIEAKAERSGKLHDLLNSPETRKEIRDQINNLKS